MFGMGTGGSSSLGSPRNWGRPKGVTPYQGRPFGLNIDGLQVIIASFELALTLAACVNSSILWSSRTSD